MSDNEFARLLADIHANNAALSRCRHQATGLLLNDADDPAVRICLDCHAVLEESVTAPSLEAA